MNKIVDSIAKILTIFIFDKAKRKELRQFIRTRIYGYNVFKNTKNIGKNIFVGGFSKTTKNTFISNNVCFNGLQIHGAAKVTIGQYFHSGVECLIIAQSHNYEGESIPYDDTYIYKDIEIGDFVWLGSRVTILPGTKIGEGAIIQAGAVVHGEIPPYAIAGGNPAKVFKYRDVEHFKKLKLKRKFH
jgi:acetyltransferase-like isoleucine patch superfamily enzyme